MQLEKHTKSENPGILGVLSDGIKVLILANYYLVASFFSSKEEGLEVFLQRKLALKEKTRRQKPFRFLGGFYSWVLRNIISRTAAFCWLGKVDGGENIPKEGPFLIVPNHQSYLDFMLIIWVFRKSNNLKFFVKPNYFDKRLWNFFLAPMGHLRADSGSLRRAIRILQEEKTPIALFPEGKRTENGEIGELSGGLAVIARKIPDLKLVPVGVRGAFGVWSRHKKLPRPPKRSVKISIGNPISWEDFKKKGEKEQFSAEIQGIWKQLIAKT